MLTCKISEIVSNCMTADDFGCDLPKFAKLVEAEATGADVVVLALAVEVDADLPATSYFDVMLADGTKINAVAGMHLKGIQNWK